MAAMTYEEQVAYHIESKRAFLAGERDTISTMGAMDIHRDSAGCTPEAKCPGCAYLARQEAEREARIAARTLPAVAGEIEVGTKVRRKSGRVTVTGVVERIFKADGYYRKGGKSGQLARVRWENSFAMLRGGYRDNHSTVALSSLVRVG